MAEKPAFFEQLIASLAILLATAIWGLSFVFSKTAFNDLSPFWFLICRYGLAAFVLLIVAHKKINLLNRKIFMQAIPVGLALFVANALQTSSLYRGDVGNTAFITCTYVVFVPLVACFFGNKLYRSQMAITLLTFVGLAIFSYNPGQGFTNGEYFALASSFVYALHFVLLGKYTRGIDSLLLSFMQIIICFVCYIPTALIFEPLPSLVNFTPSVFTSLAYTAILSTAVAFFLQTAAQKHLSPQQTSVLFTAESLFSAFFGWLILNEMFTSRQFLGGTILICCMIAILVVPNMLNKKRINIEQSS